MEKEKGNKYFFEPKEEEKNTSSTSGNIVSKATSRNRAISHNSDNNHTYAQAASLMSRHFTFDEEQLDYKKTIPKSIIIFIICGVIAFFLGPKYILTYSTKYMGNSLTNLMPGLKEGTFNTYQLIMDTFTVGMLGFFFALFIYSGYNLVRKGYCLETFKEDTLKIFGCSIMIAFLIAMLGQVIKVNIVKIIIKVLTFGGLTFKYKI